MGEPAPETKQEIATKLVQEIVKNGEEIPEKFLHKNGFPEAIDDPDLWNDSLLVDFSLLSSSSSLSPAVVDELAKLRSALSQWGCFQVINHGIERSFLEELIEAAKQFFALPVEEKLKCSTAGDVFQGYGSDSGYAGTQSVNWNDRLFLTFYPDEKRQLQFYPQTPKFRGLILEYSEKLAAMAEAFYKAMARCLDLQEDCFSKHQGKGTITGRFTYYPPCPHPENVLGVKPHSDGCCMTILLPDSEVDGLQVQKDDLWYKVPVIPGALFINFGDLGEVMSNGIFKSVMHRVVTNSEKERVSVAAFCTPESVYEIGPVSELVDDDHPQMYKKFDIHEFRRVFFETYPQGRRTLDALKL